MRTKIAVATFALIGVGATSIAALDPPINMQGSDTIFLITKDVILGCEGGLGINYVGSGSSNGQNNMTNACKGVVPTGSNTLQTVAPMSRFLNGTVVGGTCGCTAGGGAGQNAGAVAGKQSEGVAFALDGLAIIANGTVAPSSCGGIAFNKTITHTGGTYTANSAFDFLRVAYFGILNSDPSGAAPQCGGDVRRALLSNYGNLFQNACPSGTGACPTGVRHLWRRDDGSGTTDVFVSLVGGGAAISKFCNVNGGLTVTNGQVLGGVNKNGHDFQDNDPIRVPCAGNGLTAGEQVCGDAGQGKLGTLGTVLTVFVPETIDVPAAEIYPVGLCTAGVVAALPATRSTYTGLCPSGGPSFGGKCFSSMFRNPDGSLNANCIQPTGTGRCPTLVPSGTDCRGANLWLRRPNGDIVVETSVPSQRTAPPVPPNGRLYLGAFYKMHVTTRITGATANCATPSASEQIGCLSSLASPCSLGYAGSGGADIAPAVKLDVGGVVNDVTHIQNLVNIGPYDPVTNPNTYPLARKLYLNTSIGFENVTGQELALSRCFSNDAFMAARITGNGFIQLPPNGLGKRARCESYDESVCTGGGGPTDSCVGNPAGVAPNN